MTMSKKQRLARNAFAQRLMIDFGRYALQRRPGRALSRTLAKRRKR